MRIFSHFLSISSYVFFKLASQFEPWLYFTMFDILLEKDFSKNINFYRRITYKNIQLGLRFGMFFAWAKNMHVVLRFSNAWLVCDNTDFYN